MKAFKYGIGLFALVLLMAQSSFAITYTVCQSGNCDYKSIQAALKDAKAQDEIVITDDAVYAEQVTIDSTQNFLVLRSETPQGGKKPTIKFQDKVNVGPATAADALIDSKINFDQNGALRVLGAGGVRIEGLIVDGGGNYPFGYDGIWESKYALQHGNAAITLWVAGDVVIRDCEMRNAYFGVNVKDRNEGGVFANPNPADISPENIIPFSAFAKTGNHLFEYCRIHDNSVGMFFESTWDMGSTLRYNLFYENHHPTAAIASKVKTLTSEGGNQSGGALMFKDQLLSPLAIYNNTFWHNSVIFLGNWKSGAHHLVFNNIFARPDEYWGASTTTFGTHNDMSKCLVNRMHSCVYAAQQQAPSANYTAITNDLKPVQSAGGTYTEGVLISPFPASAEIYWVETKFISTDPDDPQFLTPDWTDPFVVSNIIDKGWLEAGVKDPNGSRADLGAIPADGGRPVDVVTIRPTKPVEIKGQSAIINFEVTPRLPETTPKDFKIVYLYAVTKLDTSDIFGGNYKPIATTSIIKMAYTKAIVKGANMIEVPLPAGGTGNFAFFEMIIEGTGTDGQPFTTSVGFIPYRKFDYVLEVTVLDKIGGVAVTTVRAGQQVALKVVATNAGAPFSNKIDPTDVSLQSRFDLLNYTGGKVTSIPGGISGTATTEAVFTRVPIGGVEFVHVTGKWINNNKVVAFFGTSQGVTVLAGPADSVVFIQPASKKTSIIEPGTTSPVKVQAFDKYGNPVDSTYNIKVVSLKPDIGRINDTIEPTKVGGISTHYALVTNGDKDDIFPIVASLVDKPTKTDTAYLKVGTALDKLWIFYGDTITYDPTARIEACVGVRVPVTIRASNSENGKTIITTRTTTITIKLSNDLAAYATATSAEKIQTAALVAGKVTIWITAPGKNVNNGSITVSPLSETNIKNGDRSNIVFNSCNPIPQRGAYFTTNGRGAVDFAKVYYDSALEVSEIPDSIEFFWPSLTGETRIAKKQDITLDPADKRIINVTLPQPFSAGVTRFTESNVGLGKAYWTNPNAENAITNGVPFAMADSIGPLLKTATLIERLTPGKNDSLKITFTESVPFESVKLNALTLLKKQADGTFVPVVLEILSAQPDSNGATVVTVKNVTEANTPKEGDSLRITPAGPIMDVSNNKAHLLNRAVVLTSQKIAPDIVSAKYEDRNADGKIETVQISFNKAVSINEMGMQFKWENVTSNFKADSTRFTLVNPTTIDVNIAGLFTESALRNKTSGILSVTVVFSSYDENNRKDQMVNDGAAPVVDSVYYYYGKLIDDPANPDVYKHDTDEVVVKFTEALKTPPIGDEPILFSAGSGNTPYTVKLRYVETIGGATTKYRFKVLSLQEGIHPVEADPDAGTPGDSAKINVEAKVSDNVGAGNVQSNAANRRVGIKVIKPPFELKTKVGPNPFNPRAGAQVQIVLKGKTEVTTKVEFDEVTVSIYDKVGNQVFKLPDDDMSAYKTRNGKITASDSCVLVWKGINRKGRVVGDGTYVVSIQSRYKRAEDKDASRDFKVIKIGVSGK